MYTIFELYINKKITHEYVHISSCFKQNAPKEETG
jgi:hypothetical protein